MWPLEVWTLCHSFLSITLLVCWRKSPCFKLKYFKTLTRRYCEIQNCLFLFSGSSSLAGYVEALASRLGLSIPDLTPKQADMWQTRLSAHLVSILWAALLAWSFFCFNYLINAFCHFFHFFLNDHQHCACSPEGLVMSPRQGESWDWICLGLSGFLYAASPEWLVTWIVSAMTLCMLCRYLGWALAMVIR